MGRGPPLKRGRKRFAYCGMRTRGLDRWSDIRWSPPDGVASKHAQPTATNRSEY